MTTNTYTLKRVPQILESELLPQLERVAPDLGIENSPKLKPHRATSIWQAEPSLLEALSEVFEALAQLVERKWDSLNVETKELIISFTYDSILGEDLGEKTKKQTKQTNKFKKALTIIRLFLWIIIIWFRGGKSSLFSFADSLMHFKDAVLYTVEQENPTYQKELHKVLEEASTLSQKSKTMTREQFSEWFDSI